MTEIWTLKNKEKLWDDMCTYVYSEGTITHLRLQLIEDIKDMPYSSADFDELKNDFINLINKRFGVE